MPAVWISSVAPEPAYRAAAWVTAARSVMSQRGADTRASWLPVSSRSTAASIPLRLNRVRLRVPRCRQYRA
ncbi:hypothetical protein PICSAR26_03944 [Mycobacterium avium subsp. paratuberculosis]|nr:hypothetical protein PICSAR26_03944 [Mycobacterium avium subsp. paratuberculosis]CAG7318402.1 hypothetical protein PICSAR65_01950 [Mycobacterium avium subsp. paratuberculosis]